MLVLATLLGTASCGDDSVQKKASEAPSATSTVPSGAEQSDLNDPVGAVDMLSDFSCEFNDGTWAGSATLTNTSDTKAAFEVTFSVIETAGNAVVGAKTERVTLKPGASTAVEAADIASTRDPDGTQCVRRVLKSS